MPLYQLLRTDVSLHWSREQSQAFQKPKDFLFSAQVLVHFDPSLKIVLACDVSDYGLEAVLSCWGIDLFSLNKDRSGLWSVTIEKWTKSNYSNYTGQGFFFNLWVLSFRVTQHPRDECYRFFTAVRQTVWPRIKFRDGLLHSHHMNIQLNGRTQSHMLCWHT